jgi:hypothetical protein
MLLGEGFRKPADVREDDQLGAFKLFEGESV